MENNMSQLKDFQLMLKQMGFANVGYTEDGVADIAEREFAIMQGANGIEVLFGEGSEMSSMGYSFCFNKDGAFTTHKSVE
jgi:hypothetical protein